MRVTSRALALAAGVLSLLSASGASAREQVALHGGAHTNIYITRESGGKLIRLSNNREGQEDHLAYDPSWSPDGRRLVFTEVTCHMCDSEIHVMQSRPARGKGWAGRTIAIGFHPRWSPDGGRIAYVGRSGGIYVMSADGSHRRLLVKRGLADDGPSWSPDGKQIVFTMQQTASLWRLYLVDADGQHLRPITTGPESAVNPSWSPDGRSIAFARQQGLWQLYILRLATRQLRRVSDGRWSDSWPVWSPDGRRLAFVRQEQAGNAIYRVGVSGRDVRRVSPRAYIAVQPAWSPRGDRVAFAGDTRRP